VTPAPSPMTAEEHLLLNEVIEKQFGLSFGAAKRAFLESRLRPRLQSLHLKRFVDYYLLLQYDLGGELDHLARLVTNNETYFFRETYQFEGLFADGIDVLREGRQGTSLRLLSAGCSSGEEAHTLAIFAAERLEQMATRIDAFDIDIDRLAVAKRGVYGGGSMRSVTDHQRNQFFDPADAGRSEVKSRYREIVRFSQGNILKGETYSHGAPYDALFCRNVLIYFSDAGFHEAIQNFSDVLRPGGLLFLGHSESLIGRSERFETIRLEHCIAYRKVGG